MEWNDAWTSHPCHFFPLLPHSMKFKGGILRRHNLWNAPQSRCLDCKIPAGKSFGVYCGNYLTQQGQLPPFQMVWHGNCFKMQHDDPYPIVKLCSYNADDNNLRIPDEEGHMEYRSARNMDHLVCPFQCNMCRSWNIKKRSPRAHSQFDYSLMVVIWRGSVDAFWRRRSGVVTNTRQGVQTIFTLIMERMVSIRSHQIYVHIRGWLG